MLSFHFLHGSFWQVNNSWNHSQYVREVTGSGCGHSVPKHSFLFIQSEKFCNLLSLESSVLPCIDCEIVYWMLEYKMLQKCSKTDLLVAYYFFFSNCVFMVRFMVNPDTQIKINFWMESQSAAYDNYFSKTIMKLIFHMKQLFQCHQTKGVIKFALIILLWNNMYAFYKKIPFANFA